MPETALVDFVGPQNNQPEITLMVPDMNSEPESSVNGIADGASVTVVFHEGVGIINPSEGGSYDMTIRTSSDTDPLTLTNAVFIPVQIDLSSLGDPRG